MVKDRVYICAPIFGRGAGERREYFENVSKHLAANGFMPVSPVKKGMDVDTDIKKRLKYQIRLLSGCERIVLCEGWESSDECQKVATAALWCGILVLPMTAIGL